jgi:HSP20 family protein
MLTTRSNVPSLERVFDEIVRSAFRGGADTQPFTVAADVRENEGEYTFQLDVPGVKVDNLEITLTNRVLEVRGARHFEGGENEKVARGRPHGEFAASYSLPDSIEEEKMTADLADGVLTIRVPKHPKSQPRRIPIGRDADRTQTVG